jgi:hypothetical protein
VSAKHLDPTSDILSANLLVILLARVCHPKRYSLVILSEAKDLNWESVMTLRRKK